MLKVDCTKKQKKVINTMPSAKKPAPRKQSAKKLPSNNLLLGSFLHKRFMIPMLFVCAFAVIGLVALKFSLAATGVPVSVRARGTTGQEQIQLRLDGEIFASWTLSTTERTYTYTHPSSIGANSLRVYFVNNGLTSTGADKNAIINNVDVNGKRFETEATTTFSEGSWSAATGCGPAYTASEWLACDGYLQYATADAGKLAVASSTKVNVVARGSTGQEQIQLRIDGVTYASWALTTAAKTFTYTHPTGIGANSLRVYFVNNGLTSTGADKNAIVDKIEVNGQPFQTEASTTYSEGSWDPAGGCNPGYKSSEWIACDGFMQYNIGGAGSVVQAGCNEAQRVTAVVAHADDELLFMNPDIDNKLKAGACMSAVYLTAGDARLNVGYATDRTYGAKSAWAKMVGVKNAWSSSYVTMSVAGRTQSVLKATLEAKPGVRLYFLDAVEGYQDGTRPEGSLQKLWLNQVAQLPTVNPLPAYTRQSMLDTITQILRNEQPAEAYIQDTTNHKTMDHSDHTYAAQFATQSVAAYKSTMPVAKYMGYATYTYKQNVSFNDYDRKMAIYHAYDKFDKQTHQDYDFSRSIQPLYRSSLVPHQYRMAASYPMQSASNRVFRNGGALTGISGLCMDTENGAWDEGTVAQVWGCEGVSAQYWRVSDLGEIIDNHDHCLDVRGPFAQAGAKLEMWYCIDSNTQRWDRTASNEIKMRNTNLCITSSDDAGNPNSDYGNDLKLATCAHTAGQIWNYPELLP